MNFKITYFIPLLLSVFLFSCIGTDYTDEIIGEDLRSATIEESQVSLLIGESRKLSFQFFNINGSEEEANWIFYSSKESIAEVTPEGLISAISTGQTMVLGVANGEYKDSVLVTVVSDSSQVASINIFSSSRSIMVDSMLQFTSEVRTLRGDLVPNASVSWNSSDLNVGTISMDGLFTGLSDGSTEITATYQGVSSSATAIMVSSSSGRMGDFSGLNGYSVSGSVILMGQTGAATLELQSNFVSQSGPGLKVILGTNGTNISGGLDLGVLRSSTGVQSYALPSNSNPDDFTHVFIYCQPFSIPFGVAALN